jgi:hypothetical protein
MKKAKILLSAAGILSVIAGVFAFKTQHKFGGRYFCTTIYCSTSYFSVRYTTSVTGMTLYCSAIATASKCMTTKAIVNL